MQLTPDLRPTTGELYGHVFENPRTGVPRGLYWSLSAAFETVALDGAEWEASVAVDWLTFDVRRWTDLAGSGRSSIVRPELVEASVYFSAMHQWAQLEALRLGDARTTQWAASVAVDCELEFPDGSRSARSVISWRGPIEFRGIYLVPENFSPRPRTSDDVTAIVRAFIDPSGFEPPQEDGFRFVLRPLDRTTL